MEIFIPTRTKYSKDVIIKEIEKELDETKRSLEAEEILKVAA